MAKSKKLLRWYVIIDPDEGGSTLLVLGDSGRYEARSASGRQKIDLCPDCTLLLEFWQG